MEFTVEDVAREVGGVVVGDGRLKIRGIASVENAAEGQITYAVDAKNIVKAERTKALCVIVPGESVCNGKTLIRVKHPKLAFAKALELFYPDKTYREGVHPTAVIGSSVKIGKGVHIGAHVVIGDNVQVGAESVIRPGVVIGDNCVLGTHCIVHPNVTMYDQTVLGNRVTIHAGTAIGGDGFGYVQSSGKQVKIPQKGNVVIEDDVEVGCNVCIDRATIGSTIVKRGTKIDNLVQISHNDVIGEDSIIVAQVGISGSTTLGHHVTLAGQVGISDHVTLGDNVAVGAQSGVAPGKKVPSGSVIFGSPARDMNQAKKQLAALGRLTKYIKAISRLEREADEPVKK